MKRIVGWMLLAICSSLPAAPPTAIPIFSDDFESGTMSLWTTTGTSPLTIATPQNAVPAGGMYSALMNTSADRMHHNIIADNGGAEVGAPSLFTCYIYDPGPTAPATRIFNEVRGYSGGTGLPNGSTVASGTLAQLFAIGKYNTVTLPGEVYNGNKYQARVTFPTITGGWFNLNAAGSPNRSVGWHRFDIERMPDGTTINFYVDGILSRSFTGATAATWDTVVMGPGLGTTVGDAWIDGMFVGRADYPPVITCPENMTVPATSASGAVVNYNVTASDDNDPNLTVVCNPPSGSTFPIGTTSVDCSVTDDSGNTVRCSFLVTVTPPIIFEGFEVYPKGQAVLHPDPNERRLPVQNLGSSGQDGVDISLRQVDAIILNLVPTGPQYNNTCIVTRVEATLDGAVVDNLIRTELLLDLNQPTARADFSRLGSTETEVQVRGPKNELLDTYQISNGGVINLDSLFPPCDPGVVVYQYYQGEDLVWWRFCKVGCIGCVGTNCWTERVLCLRALVPAPRNIELRGLAVCAQGPTTSSLTIEDLKFVKFGNEHHASGMVLVDGSNGPLAVDNIGSSGQDGVSITPIDQFHPGGVNNIQIDLVPLSLAGGITPCVTVGACGMVDGLPKQPLGSVAYALRQGKKTPELRADFQPLGATMVELQVFGAGQLIGKTTLPNGLLGDLSGDGGLARAGGFPAGEGAFSRRPSLVLQFTSPVDFSGVDGSMFKGDEFRMAPADPKLQVQSIECLSLMAEGIPGFTILNETFDSAGQQFFPDDVFPPPTATFGTFPTMVQTYRGGGGGGGAGGVIALRRQQLSFFDVFTELPPAGQSLEHQCDAILEMEYAPGTAPQGFQCRDVRGTVRWRLTGIPPPDPDHGNLIDIEILSMDLRRGSLMVRESPSRPSLGRLSAQPLSTGGYMIDSFFDVFTELSTDGGQTWLPSDSSTRFDLMGYDVGPFPTPNLPPPVGAFAMQCPSVDYMNQVMIRNLALHGLSQGPPLDSIPLGSSMTVPFQGACSLEHSQDGGRTWQPAEGACRGMMLVGHDFDYEETRFFDTEMLQLDLRGGTIPPGAEFRESPTLRSHGRACLSRNDTGQGSYSLASFFDVFTEITLDGGQTFVPAERPARLTLAHDNCLTITCPPDIREWTCSQGKVVNYPPPTATSACGTTPVIECMPPSGSFFPVGTTTVNCRATDAAGNTAFCSFKVEVIEDSAPPRIVCPTTEIVRWACSPGGTVVDYPVTATDDCDTDVTIRCNPPAGTVLPPGMHTVTCEAIDDCGKRDQCQFTVVVREDTEPPRIICSSNIVVWTCNPDGANVGYTVTATDDCDEDVELTCTPPPGHFNPGTTTVTCRAIDGCNKQSSCTFTVTVRVDQEPPVLNCPSNIVVWTCNPDGTKVDYTVTATDDCDPDPTVECIPPSGSNFPPGVHNVRCRALDDCNHASFCDFTVTVRHDTEAPRIVCPGNITNWVCSPNGGPVTYTVTATDDCDPNPTIVCNPPSGSNFPPGATTVDCVATDDCGNKDQCRFVVFVNEDKEPPRLMCPEKIEICTCNPDGTNVTYTVSATDDCDTDVTIVCNPPSGSHFPPGTTMVTCTARDDCGNTSQCSFPVTVIVNTVAITCPPDMTVLTCSNSAVVNYPVNVAERCRDTGTGNRCVAPDNGSGTARLPADCPYGSNEKMTIRDGLPPGDTVEIAPLFHTVVCSPMAPTPPPCPSDCYVQDDCNPRNGEVVLYESTAELTLEGTGMFAGYRRTLVIPHFLEKEGHAARNPGDPVQSFMTDKLQLFGQLPPGDPDFDLLRITAGTDFGLPSPGHTTLTRAGAASWAVDSFFDITYRIDFVGAPGGPFAGRSGSTTGTIRIGNSTGPSGPTVVCNPPSGSSFPVGTTTVTCRVTNECGFSDSCQFRVTVEADQEPPRISCPSELREGDGGGIQAWTCTNGAVVNYTVTATDDTDPNVTIVCNPPSGSFFPVGTTIVWCEATDDCGRTDRCEFPVHVIKDTQAPVLTCPDNIVVWTCDTPGAQPGAKVNYTVTVTDDCDTNVTVVCNPPSGSDFPEGITRVRCVAIDDCQNRSECEFSVRVIVDREPPRLVCPDDMRLWTCSPNGMIVDYTVAVTDDCDTNVTVNCSPASGTPFPPGTNRVVCLARDDCGNQSQCSFLVVVVVDREPPRIVCPSNIVVWVCERPGQPPGQRVEYAPTVSDDCDTNVMVTCNPPSGTFFPPGVHNVTCTAEDDCGHKSECSFQVRVILDTQPPTIVCPNDIVVRTCRDCYPVSYRVEARDDCDTNVTVVCEPPPGTCFPLGTNEVRCVATDDCGNRAECKFRVIVLREEGPRITITRLPQGFVKICWPAPSVGWRLQCTRSLNPPITWEFVTEPVQVMGNDNCVVLPHNDRHRFYRLCKPCDPVITGVSHLRPREGDVITITGSGFGRDPNNLCVVIVERPNYNTTSPPPTAESIGLGGLEDSIRFIPLRALSAQDMFMNCCVGAVPPDVRPGHIMVGHGIGEVGRPMLAFPDIILEEPVWTWRKFGPAGIGDQEIEPQPNQPTPNKDCFFSGPPENGELCVFVQGDWGTNCYISIIARAHDSVNETGGHDLDGPTVRFLNAGTTRDCVERIADVIRCAFAQQAGVQVQVTVEEVPPGSGVFKITVRIPDGYIDRGMLTICVQCPEQPVITDFTPKTARAGEVVRVRGTGFPTDPNDVCMVAMDGDTGHLIPFQVLDSNGTELNARLGPVPPNAQPGPIMVGLGQGNMGRFRPAFFDVFVADDVWVWRKRGPATLSEVPFQPIPVPPPPSNCWFFSGPPVEGKLCVFLTPDCPWPSNATVSVIARAHDATTGAGGHDLAAPNVRFVGGGSLRECADRVADIIRCAFQQQAGVTVGVQVDVLPDGRVKITVFIPGGYIDRGMLTICVGPSPTSPTGGP